MSLVEGCTATARDEDGSIRTCFLRADHRTGPGSNQIKVELQAMAGLGRIISWRDGETPIDLSNNLPVNAP